jgi:thiol-disulfide isomerase/thioredoxin
MKVPIKLKKYLTLSNGLFLILSLIIVMTQGKNILNNFMTEGMKIEIQQVYSFNESQNISYPPPGTRTMAIFWSSTCAPCMLEMKRLNNSVVGGHIAKRKIFAINMGESPESIRRFIKKTSYPFHFISAPDIIRKLKVRGTPTSMLLDQNEIISMNTGISLIGIWRAEFFLR